jgi:transcriptional regulator with XRE-family HTH domain
MHTRKEIVPNNLKEFRVKAGLTQMAIATQLGLSQSKQDRISKWEHGVATPSLENVIKLCRVYKVSFEEAICFLAKRFNSAEYLSL